MKMENIMEVTVLRFPVIAREESGVPEVIPIIIRKDQLQAAQLVGQSSKELIHRIFNRNGYAVLDIGKADRRTIKVNLDDLWGCD